VIDFRSLSDYSGSNKQAPSKQQAITKPSKDQAAMAPVKFITPSAVVIWLAVVRGASLPSVKERQLADPDGKQSAARCALQS
jgi:hypothetical protein